MDPHQNPYTPGAGARPPRLVGRDAEIKDFGVAFKWREAEGPTITLSDAETAEELVNDELDRRFFRDRYERATEAERIYMAAMADLGDGRHSSGEISKRLGMVPKELSVRRAGLIEKGLIFNRGHTARLHRPAVRRLPEAGPPVRPHRASHPRSSLPSVISGLTVSKTRFSLA